MQPKLILLTEDIIERILDEAYQLLLKPGIKVNNEEARDLLASAGAQIDLETNVVKIPEQIARKALETAPREFYLYDYDGNPTVKYGGDAVHFDPGSSGIAMLNPETLEHDTTETQHLLKLIKSGGTIIAIRRTIHRSCLSRCAATNSGFISPVSGTAIFQETHRHRGIHK